MALAKFIKPRKSLREYMTIYAKEHTQLGTKITHMIGIPMIVASLPTALVSPPAAGALFVGGWALQFVGHYYFEKNKPAFFGDPYYMLVGPVWVAAEFAQLAGVPLPEALTPLPETEQEPASAAVANGHAAAHP
jgi:uncharacterized membrane protein YGL010W